jgi:hypothetical protein
MRFLSLSLVTVTIASAHQMLAAQTPPPVGVLASSNANRRDADITWQVTATQCTA